MAYRLKSLYGYVLTEVAAAPSVSLSSTSVLGDGAVAAGSLTLNANLVSLSPAALAGDGAVAAGSLTLNANLVSLASAALAGDGAVTAGALALGIALAPVAVAGDGAVTAGTLSRVLASPTTLGTAKLRLWTRPESPAWTTSGRSIAETGTGLIGAKDDESGNAFHLTQTTSGLRPTRKANGGFRCNGTALSTASAIGAWAGDFDVWAVVKQNSFTANYRVMEVSYATGFGILQSAPDRVKLSIAASASPYGFDTTTALTTIHLLHCWRSGTTASISVDGAAPATATVTSGALANTAFFVGLSNALTFGGDVDIHEIAVCTGLTAGEQTDMNGYFAARQASGVYT